MILCYHSLEKMSRYQWNENVYYNQCQKENVNIICDICIT